MTHHTERTDAAKWRRNALPVLAIIILAAAALAAKSVKLKQGISPDGLQSGSPWPKDNANLQNTGVTSAAGLGGGLRWAFYPDNQGFDAGPVIGSDGTVYIGSSSGTFYAFNGTTGAKKWTFAAPAQIGTTAAIGSDGTVYFNDYDGNVYALNGSTGTELWTFADGAGLGGGEPRGLTIFDGTIYVGSNNNSVYAVDAATGTKLWTSSSATNSVFTTPAIDINGNVDVGSNDFFVYSLNALSGAKNWEFGTTGVVDASISAGSNGMLYCSSDDGNLYALDAATGNQDWTYPAGGASTPAIGPDGSIYYGAIDGYLHALNGTTGTQEWSFLTGGYVDSSPALDSNGVLYFGSTNQNFYAVQSQTGAELWSFATGGLITTDPAIGADGTIYVASDKLYAFNAATISNFYCSPAPVFGGSNTVGVVQMANKASVCTAVVTLSGGDSNVSYPSSITLPAGKTGVSFTIGTSKVTSNQTETLTASFGSSSRQFSLIVTPPSISNFYVSPSTILGGSSTHGVVQISAPAPAGGTSVNLTSASSAVTFPAQVTVPAGSTGLSFTIGSVAQSNTTVATIMATQNSFTKSFAVTVTSLDIYVSPASVTGTYSTYGVVQLGAPSVGATTISLTSDTAGVTVPASATISSGSKGVSFLIGTSYVSAPTTAEISATWNATTSSANFAVNPYPVKTIYASPAEVIGGNPTRGVVQLTHAAGPGGLVVTLSSNADGYATLPATVTVPAGTSGVSFPITTLPVPFATTITLTATSGPSSANGTLVLFQ